MQSRKPIEPGCKAMIIPPADVLLYETVRVLDEFPHDSHKDYSIVGATKIWVIDIAHPEYPFIPTSIADESVLMRIDDPDIEEEIKQEMERVKS